VLPDFKSLLALRICHLYLDFSLYAGFAVMRLSILCLLLLSILSDLFLFGSAIFLFPGSFHSIRFRDLSAR
jgi:hypothetical protein